MPELANSDTHTSNLGGTFTLARGDTFPEWIENVRRGDYYLRLSHMDRKLFRGEVWRWLELAFHFEPQGPDAWEQARSRRFWGVGVVDRILRSVIRGRLSRLPRTRECLWALARMLLRAGVTDLYVLSEIRKGLDLERLLGDGETIRKLALAPAPRRRLPATIKGPARPVVPDGAQPAGPGSRSAVFSSGD
jgi:hypothetical protein